MKKMITTICLGLWVCLTGVLFAAESDAPVQDRENETVAVEQIEPVELSIDPEDELLRLLEADPVPQRPQTPEAQPTKSQLQSPEVEETKPVESVAPVVPIENEPNEVETTELLPVLTQHEEKDDFRSIRKKLMFGQMESVDEMTEEEKADGLEKLIRQLKSLETPPKITPEEKTQPQADPVQVSGVPETAVPVVEAESKELFGPVKPENDLLVRLEKADNVLEPLRLADVLYRQQYYEQAFKYYQLTLETLSSEDIPNRQWVLFQMGNCTRQIDPGKAIEVYSELIEAYPNAKWTSIAMARRSILQWSQDNKIDELIAGDIQ